MINTLKQHQSLTFAGGFVGGLPSAGFVLLSLAIEFSERKWMKHQLLQRYQESMIKSVI